MIFDKNEKCRLCGGKSLSLFLSLPAAALAGEPVDKPARALKIENGRRAGIFLNSPAASDEDAGGRCFPLDVYYCRRCGLIQLVDIVPPDIYKKYIYTPAYAGGFKKYAEWLCADIINKFSPCSAVEIGCGEGALLECFASRGVFASGFEPSSGLSAAAGENVHIINDYFTKDSVRKLSRLFLKYAVSSKESGISSPGRACADVIIMRHVLEHLNDFDSVMRGVKCLLNRSYGVFALEVPWAGDIIAQKQFYAFFHEHLSYFSLTNLKFLLEKHGLQVIEAVKNNLEGGSVLIYAVFNDSIYARNAVFNIAPVFSCEPELLSPDRLKIFASEMKSYYDNLKKFISGARREGAVICGWGAGQRGVSLINACNFDSGDIKFVIDVNPFYNDKFIPGSDIVIKAPEILENYREINTIIIFATGYADEIMNSCAKFIARGGKFISIVEKAGWYD